MKYNKDGYLRVLGLIFPYFIILSFFQYFGLLFANVDFLNGKNPETINQHVIMSFSSLLSTYLILWLFMKYVDKEKFISLGFQIKNRLKDFLLGFLLSVLIISFSIILLLILNEITIVNSILNFNELLMITLLFLIVALTEEALFRGYILKNLMLSFNKYFALGISSLLFALLHSANPNISLFSFFNLFLAGILLGISYIYTKNLWFPIALHFSWNLTQTFLGFNVSGLDVYSIIEIEITENNLLNGGDFGFEGSVLSIFAQVIFIILIWLYYNTKQTHQSKSTL